MDDQIWTFIKKWEGGSAITNDPKDTGGLTKYGISKVNNPDIDVANLTEMDAQLIFEERYYIPAKCEEIPAFMRLVHMNCAVNCGVKTSIKTLQRVLGAKVDGIAGPQTIGRANHYFKGPRVFVGWYLTYQAMYYFNIVERRRSQHKWLRGWIRRTIDAAWQSAVNYGKR